MGDTPIKYTLTVNERQALEGVRKMDSALDATTDKAKRAAKELTNVEKAMSQAVKSMGFQGSASSAQWLSRSIPRIDPKTVQSGYLATSFESQAKVATRGLVNDIEKMRSMILADPGRIARAKSSNERFEAGFGDDSRGRRSAFKRVSTFIQKNELGAVDDDVTRYVSRIAMGLQKRIIDNAKKVFSAAGGSREVLQLAQLRGVNTGSPSAVGAFRSGLEDDVMASRLAAGPLREIRSERLAKANSLRAAKIQSYMRGQEREGWAGEFESERSAFEAETADRSRMANRRRIERVFSEGSWDGAAWDRSNLRSNRMARAKQLRAQQSAARWSTGSQIAGSAAGAGASAILGTESVLGLYNANLGERFSALSGSEPMFRELMALGNNATKQKEIRGSVLDSAIAFARPVTEAAAFRSYIESSAGNLSSAKQKQIVSSSLVLQSTMGGELPVLGKALTTIEQLYGAKIGSVDRASSLIKRAVDFGKFTPTAFAQLAPEALSAASMRGYNPEEAFAALSVASLRSGRDENMFTGARYVFSMMDKAADQGMVTRGAPLVDQLRQLQGATPNQMKDVFGMEGVNVASNLRDMVGDVESLVNNMKGLTGAEVRDKRSVLMNDPVNAMSRYAGSIESLGQSSMQILVDSGAATKEVGNAVDTRLALEGQRLLAPDIAALSDVTKSTNLQLRKKEYIKTATSMIAPALMKAGDRQQLALNSFSAGDVQVGWQVGEDNSASWAPDLGWLGEFMEGKSPKMSSSQDHARYLGLNKEFGLTFSAMEAGQILTAREDGDAKAEQLAVDRARKRKKFLEAQAKEANAPVLGKAASETPATADPFSVFGSINTPINDHLMKLEGEFGVDSNRYKAALQAAKSVWDHEKKFTDVADLLGPERKNAEFQNIARTMPAFDVATIAQNEDILNTKTIGDAVSLASKKLADARKVGDLYGADAAAGELGKITSRRLELIEDDGIYSAEDRRTLAEELNPNKTATAAGPNVLDRILQAIEGIRVSGVPIFSTDTPPAGPGAPGTPAIP